MNIQAPALLLLLASFAGQAKPAHTPTRQQETPHVQFVQEFIRELIEDEDLKTRSDKEFSEAKTPDENLSAAIYFSKSTQLLLRSQTSVLKSMHLNDPFGDLITTLIALNQHQIDTHQKLLDIYGKLMTGPKPGIDYPALVAKLPEIRAELDDIRKKLLEVAPLVFWVLVDTRPDSKDHLSHLVITKAERADVLDQLNILLKDVPEEGDQDFYVSAAMVLRAGFQKGHKCADDPWE